MNPAVLKIRDALLDHVAKKLPVEYLCIDATTEQEIAAFTPEEVGPEMYGQLVREGPRSFNKLFGIPVVWDATEFGVL